MSFLPLHQRPAAAWAVAAGVVLALGYLAWIAGARLATLSSSSPAELDVPGVDRFRLSGFRHTVYLGDRPAMDIEAREVVHRKRKIGPVTVLPLKELVMSGVTLRLHLDPASTGGAGEAPPLVELMGSTLADKGLGVLTRIEMEDLEFSERLGETVLYSLSAHDATIGEDRAVALSGGFLLVTAKGDQLRAQDGRWQVAERVFQVEGPWQLRGAAGPSAGSGGRFHLSSWGAIVRR